MARKRAPGDPKRHDKLELLGGHLDEGESASVALLRELSEEEATGELARLVEAQAPDGRCALADGALHHLFEIILDADDAAALRHDPSESLGFEFVRTRDLDAGDLDERLTPRTREILKAFGPSPELEV